MSKLEKELEKEAGRILKKAGCEYIKIALKNDNHWPDRLVIKPDNYAFFIEFKRLGEKLRPAQGAKKRELESRKRRVYVCDNIDQLKLIMHYEGL